MIATLVAILFLLVLGLPVTLVVDRGARGLLLLGTSFLHGSGTMFVVLLMLSAAHVQWTLVTATSSGLIVFVALFVVVIRQRPAATITAASGFHVPDVVSLYTLICFALYATASSLWDWDFWAIWGLKGRVFYEAGGIDWHFLESGWNTFAHPDYPLLVPLNFDFLTLVNGAWSDRWLGLLYVAWAVALLVVVRALASREVSPLVASLVAMAAASLSFSRHLGIGEGALIAFGGAGLLFVRAALLDDDPASWRQGAVLLGFAANCKNEGLALLAAVTIAVAVAWTSSGERGETVSRPTRTAALLRLWPAYLLAAPWLLLRLAHVLPTDLAGGSLSARLLAHLHETRPILSFLVARLEDPWFWSVILVSLLLAPAAARRGELFILLATAIQLFFYVAAYIVTPHDWRWHIATSWPRLPGQIALPVAVAVFLMLAKSLRGGQDAVHAEARSDQ